MRGSATHETGQFFVDDAYDLLPGADVLHDILADGALLCLPTAPNIAPRIDAGSKALATHRDRVLSLTSPAGLAGLPQVTLPLAQHEGCPLGLSLMAGPGADRSLLDFAASVCGDLTWPP